MNVYKYIFNLQINEINYKYVFQTAISSACIEHLDFLNTSLCPTITWESVAVTDYKNISDTGHYRSLTDVTKTPTFSEDIDYNNHVVYIFIC